MEGNGWSSEEAIRRNGCQGQSQIRERDGRIQGKEDGPKQAQAPHDRTSSSWETSVSRWRTEHKKPYEKRSVEAGKEYELKMAEYRKGEGKAAAAAAAQQADNGADDDEEEEDEEEDEEEEDEEEDDE